MKVSLYVDGSVDPNPGIGGWSAILIADNKKIGKEICGYVKKETTNNRMELFSILQGLLAIKKPEVAKVTVFSDSQWAVNAISNSTWKIKKNLDILEKIKEALSLFKNPVEFVWVKGHSDNLFNEKCDELAGFARKNKIVESSKYVRY